METILQTILTASLIDTYWSREQVYIYMTEGDCKTSYRGPDVNKVCLDEYPGYMFWINSSAIHLPGTLAYLPSDIKHRLPRYQEMSKTKISSLDVPPGWHELAGEGYAGVNQMMVVINYFNEAFQTVLTQPSGHALGGVCIHASWQERCIGARAESYPFIHR